MTFLSKVGKRLRLWGKSVLKAILVVLRFFRLVVGVVARSLGNLLKRAFSALVRRMDRDRRLLAISLIVVTLTTAGVIDRTIDRPRGIGPIAQVQAPVEGSSTAWFCALTPSTRANPENGLVTVANIGDTPVTGTVTVAPVGAPSVRVPIGIGAGSRSIIRPGDLVDAPYSGTTIQVDGGAVVAEHTVIDAATNSTAPCAASASDAWYTTDGSTADTANLLLGLYNPFPEVATVDFSFVSSESRDTPAELAGISIAPGELRVVDVGQYQKRREWITASVISRTGRIVVDQLQTNRPGGVVGSSLALASPLLSEDWFVPNGYVTAGITDELNFYNPGDREAAVEVRLLPESREAPAFEVLVPAEGRQQVRMNVEQVVPPGGRYAAVLRVTNGVPVAIGRTTVATAASPGPVQGLSMSTAAPATSTAWATAFGGTLDPFNESLWITNPGSRPAAVTVTASGAGVNEALPPIVVPPGRRAEVVLDDPAVTTVIDPAVVVRSDVPILVGRDLSRVAAGSGYQSTPVIPIR